MTRSTSDDQGEDELIASTRLESVEDIRVAFGSLPPTARESADDTVAFRPVRRPPTALLCVVYDGRTDGQWHWLQHEETVIGRGEGDIIIPHDTQMSGRHAQITRVLDRGRYRWYLTDLNSRNGVFVRISETRLPHGQLLIIGGKRLRFDAVPSTGAPAASAASPSTSGWDRPTMATFIPSLVELTAKGDGQRWFLTLGENWLGRDPSLCNVVLADDPLVSPRHARIHLDGQARWTMENAQSRNGVWVLVRRIPLEGPGHFLLGEQRFIFRPL